MFIAIFFLKQSNCVFVSLNPFLDKSDGNFHSSVNNLDHQSSNSVLVIVVLIIAPLFVPLLNDMACYRRV